MIVSYYSTRLFYTTLVSVNDRWCNNSELRGLTFFATTPSLAYVLFHIGSLSLSLFHKGMTRYYYQDDPLPRSHSAIIQWFGFDRFVPEWAVTSYWKPSKVLLCIRVATCLYSTIVIWASIGTSAIEGNFQHYFAHFTQMTYIGLHAYLVVRID